MNIPRLTHLTRILATVPPEQFDMHEWRCGTAACAVGWAAQDSQFNAEGLVLQQGDTVFTSDGSYILCFPALVGPEADGYFEPQQGFDAVNAFFGLNMHQSMRLFLRASYDRPASPMDVIARINDLITWQRREDDELAAQLEDIEQAERK